VDSSAFKQRVIDFLGLEFLKNPTNSSMIDFQIQSATVELAGMSYWTCLLREIEGTFSTSGTFIIPEPCIPSMVFIGGEGNTPSWRRVIAHEFDTFYGMQNVRGGGYYQVSRYYNNRYTINKLNPNKDVTEIQLMGQAFSAQPVKILYYPTCPPVSSFTPPFISLLLDMTLSGLFPYISENSSQFLLETLKKRIKDKKFDLIKRESQVEIAKFVKNKNIGEQGFISNGISDLLFSYGRLNSF